MNEHLQKLSKDASVNKEILGDTGKFQIGQISDGYHTFDELYEHRIALYIQLCRSFWIRDEGTPVWKSRAHSDGLVWEGWFILGLNKEAGEQITYHLPESKWDECYFAETLDKAPAWDGHTSADVLERLKNI